MPNNLKIEEGSPSLSSAESGQSANPASLGWSRFVIPSIADVIFVGLLLAFITGPLSISLLGDGGTGWHIRTGEWILRNHAIPRMDLFSSTMHGKPWYAWEWLYDAVVSALHNLAGLNGVVLFTAAVIALTFATVVKRMLARNASLAVSVVLLLIAFCASTVHFLARPHVVSWLFTVMWFSSLEKFDGDGRTRSLIWLPLLMVVWVNTHGGFLVGLILLAIYALSEYAVGMFSGSRDCNEMAFAHGTKLVGVGAMAAVATLINPYGMRLHIHIYQYLTDKFLMNHIQEFLSPDFHGFAQKCFAGLVLLSVLTAVISRARLPLRHILVLLFAIASGFYATRNIPVSSILMAMILGPQLSLLMEDISHKANLAQGARAIAARLNSFGQRMTRLDASLRGHLWPILAALLATFVCWRGGSLGGHQMMNAHFDEKRFPVQATEFLSSHADRQPVLTIDRWGGYLIYRLYPTVAVAIDDRHDLYGAEVLKDYLKIVHCEPGWESALENLHPGWVLVPENAPLASLLSGNSQWMLANQGQTAKLFKRSGSEAGSRSNHAMIGPEVTVYRY